MILEKQLLLPIIPQRGGWFTSGRHSVEPEADVLTSSPQGQTRQCSGKKIKALQASVCMFNVKVHDFMVGKRESRRKPLLSKNEHRSTAWVCKIAYEQTTKLLEQCPLDKLDLSGDVWQRCAAQRLVKAKDRLSAPHTSCRARCCRSDDWGLFLQPRDPDT